MPGDMTLGNLHLVIQDTMDWEDCHLHQFNLNDRSFGVPEDGADVENEDAFQLGALVARLGTKIEYVYDFGDDWTHDIIVEKTLLPEAGAHYPRCVGGARAAPPEDCGGVGGYANLLEAIQDPNHEEHDDLLEWVGEEFDPEAFDLEAINEQLRGAR